MKHIVVTGGAKGIGKALVQQLADRGHKITATYRGSKAAAEEITAKFPNVRYLAVDLEDRQSINDFIEALMDADPIDVLVNNAGVYVGKPFQKMTEAELYQQIDLNFAAPSRLIHGLLPSLQKAKAPLIVNVSSQAVHERISGEAMYTAAKAALSTLSYILKAELNPLGVRVVTVEPFAVNTYGIPEPSGMMLPEELAQMVCYAVELPDHLQMDNMGMSHIQQPRPDYPEWIENK